MRESRKRSLASPSWGSRETKEESHYLYYCYFLKKILQPHLVIRGMLVPPPGIEPSTPALEGKVLATGPSGKSLEIHDEEQKPRGQCEAGEDERTLGPGMDTRGDSASISSDCYA